MIKALYIHGLGSSSDSSTGKYFASLNSDDIVFYHPSFSFSPKKAIKEINDFIKDHNIDIVVGSSLGGFYALLSDAKYGVVINPALIPIDDIKNGIGTGPQEYNGTKFVLDDNFFNELEEIIRERYDVLDINDWYLKLKPLKTFGGLFGGQDKLFSHYDDFHSVNSRYVILDGLMTHHFEKEYGIYVISLLEDIIKEYNGTEINIK